MYAFRIGATSSLGCSAHRARTLTAAHACPFATAVEQRRRVFEVYLQELLCLQPRPVELNNFLDINSHIWGTGSTSGGGSNAGLASAAAAAVAGGAGAGTSGSAALSAASVGRSGADGGGLDGGAGGAGGAGGGGAAARAQLPIVGEDFVTRLKDGNVGLDDFELLRVLGKGSFGKVFLVRLIATQQVFAMKVLKKSDVVRRRQVEHTKAERRIMGGIDHPFVVPLRFAFQTADKLYMVTDYMTGGELFFHLKKLRTFPEPMVRFFAAELVCALSHLHSINIVYRDLKPENVLLDGDGHIHITDFGLSKDEVSDPRGATTFCGTPEYLAPEMLINRKSREGYGKAVDWWSLGTLVFEMLTGWPPFYDKNLRRMCEQILKSELHFPPTCTASAEARDLIRGLLQRDPAQRLGSRAGGVSDIKAHPFFRGIDWARLESRDVESPFKPKVDSDTDITNFDTTFTSEPAVLTPPAPSELVSTTCCSCLLLLPVAAANRPPLSLSLSPTLQSEAAAAHDEFSDFSFVNVGKVASALPSHLHSLYRSLIGQGSSAGKVGAGSAQDEAGDLPEFDVDDDSFVDDDEEGVGEEEGGATPPSPSAAGGGGAGGGGDGGTLPATHIEVPPRPPLSEAEAVALAQHLASLSTSPTNAGDVASPGAEAAAASATAAAAAAEEPPALGPGPAPVAE